MASVHAGHETPNRALRRASLARAPRARWCCDPNVPDLRLFAAPFAPLVLCEHIAAVAVRPAVKKPPRILHERNN
jgi:hypothetical protein